MASNSCPKIVLSLSFQLKVIKTFINLSSLINGKPHPLSVNSTKDLCKLSAVSLGLKRYASPIRTLSLQPQSSLALEFVEGLMTKC